MVVMARIQSYFAVARGAIAAVLRDRSLRYKRWKGRKARKGWRCSVGRERGADAAESGQLYRCSAQRIAFARFDIRRERPTVALAAADGRAKSGVARCEGLHLLTGHPGCHSRQRARGCHLPRRALARCESHPKRLRGASQGVGERTRAPSPSFQDIQDFGRVRPRNGKGSATEGRGLPTGKRWKLAVPYLRLGGL